MQHEDCKALVAAIMEPNVKVPSLALEPDEGLFPVAKTMQAAGPSASVSLTEMIGA